MMKNRFIALGMAAMMLFAVCPAYVSAQEPGNVAFQPFWANVSSITVSLSFSETTANCYAEISAFSGTTGISGTVKLERKNANGTYTQVKSWPVSSSNQSLVFSDTHSVTAGHTYRLTISAGVTRNGSTENVSNWAEKSL